MGVVFYDLKFKCWWMLVLLLSWELRIENWLWDLHFSMLKMISFYYYTFLSFIFLKGLFNQRCTWELLIPEYLDVYWFRQAFHYFLYAEKQFICPYMCVCVCVSEWLCVSEWFCVGGCKVGRVGMFVTRGGSIYEWFNPCIEQNNNMRVVITKWSC